MALFPQDEYLKWLKDGVELSRSFFEHISHALNPMRPWMRRYDGTKFRADTIAGLTVAGVLIPQSMAQALLVGVPPVYGLYGVLVGSSIAALWGSSPLVITAPVAVISLLTLTSLVPLATPNTPEYIALAVILALMVGLLQFLAGGFRLGFLARLIPSSVLIGFTVAAGIIIAAMQVPTLLGFSVHQDPLMYATLEQIVAHIFSLHPLTALIGVAALILMIVARRTMPGIPMGLIILGASIPLSMALGIESFGVDTIGAVPAGLPAFFLPELTLSGALSLFGSALTIAVIGFMSTYGIGTSLARTHGGHLSANQELIGQGSANIATSIAGGFPVAGSFSSSAANVVAGGRTPMVSIVLSVATLLTLTFFTKFLSYLPSAILAAVVIGSVIQLVKFSEFTKAFYISRTDGFIAGMTFVVALIVKPDTAVIFGIVVSLILFINRIMWARVDELCIDTERNIFQPCTADTDAVRLHGVLIARPNMSLVYANAEHIIEQIHWLLRTRERTGERIEHVVLSFASVNYIDLTGAEAFVDFLNDMRRRHITVHAITLKSHEKTVLEHACRDCDMPSIFASIVEMRKALASSVQTTERVRPL